MLKIAKFTGIAGSLLMLVITVIFSALHFSEPLFSAILYIGIVGSILVFIGSLGANEISKLIFILSAAGATLIFIVSVMLSIGLKADERLIAIPLVITGDSLIAIATLFEGISLKTFYRK